MGQGAVLAGSGEVDIATADRICPAVTQAAESGALDLWFDLSEVTFLDSSGMRALVAARDNAKARGARFVVICPYGPVLRVLRIAGLDRGLLIHPDRASAHPAC